MKLSIDKMKYVVQEDATIEEAWSVIEGNRHRSVVVVKGNKVVGTLSDGDLRRAILAHRILSTPVKEVMITNFVCLLKSERSEAEKMFKEKDIFLIPVVDSKMKLIDIIER